MEPAEIKEIIEMIPDYISYIYPGFLLMYVYSFCRGKNLSLSKETGIYAVCISYVMNIVVKSILERWFRNTAINRTFFLMLMAVVGAYILYACTKSKLVSDVFKEFNINTTFYESDIEALAGLEDQAWLCVYLKDDDVVYEGSLGAKELDPERERFITLEGFYKYKLDAGGYPIRPYIDDYSDNYEDRVVISYDSIKRVEKRDPSGGEQDSTEEGHDAE